MIWGEHTLPLMKIRSKKLDTLQMRGESCSFLNDKKMETLLEPTGESSLFFFMKKAKAVQVNEGIG